MSDRTSSLNARPLIRCVQPVRLWSAGTVRYYLTG